MLRACRHRRLIVMSLLSSFAGLFLLGEAGKQRTIQVGSGNGVSDCAAGGTAWAPRPRAAGDQLLRQRLRHHRQEREDAARPRLPAALARRCGWRQGSGGGCDGAATFCRVGWGRGAKVGCFGFWPEAWESTSPPLSLLPLVRAHVLAEDGMECKWQKRAREHVCRYTDGRGRPHEVYYPSLLSVQERIALAGPISFFFFLGPFGRW